MISHTMMTLSQRISKTELSTIYELPQSFQRFYDPYVMVCGAGQKIQ